MFSFSKTQSPGALPRDQQKALLEKVKDAVGKRFYDWKRLRNDAIDVMDYHVNMQPSLGALRSNPGTSYLKLEGNVYMTYNGNGYWVPLALYISTDYPVNHPICEVRPSGDLIIPPNHERVDVQGNVYLNYLHQWDKKSNLLGAIAELASAFSAKPFIFKRPAQPGPPPPPFQEDPPPPAYQPGTTHMQPSSQLLPHDYAPPSAPPGTVAAGAGTVSGSASGTVSKMAESFYCPISMELMNDPVFAADGHTYERVFIEEWLQTKTTSPLTNEPLAHKHLVPNHNLRSQIQEYRDSTSTQNAAR